MAKPGRKPSSPNDGHPFYGLSGTIEVTREQARFCERRVGGLLNYGDMSGRPLLTILANAYLLGLADATDYHRPACLEAALQPGGGECA